MRSHTWRADNDGVGDRWPAILGRLLGGLLANLFSATTSSATGTRYMLRGCNNRSTARSDVAKAENKWCVDAIKTIKTHTA